MLAIAREPRKAVAEPRMSELSDIHGSGDAANVWRSEIHASRQASDAIPRGLQCLAFRH